MLARLLIMLKSNFCWVFLRLILRLGFVLFTDLFATSTEQNVDRVQSAKRSVATPPETRKYWTLSAWLQPIPSPTQMFLFICFPLCCNELTFTIQVELLIANQFGEETKRYQYPFQLACKNRSGKIALYLSTIIDPNGPVQNFFRIPS